MAARTARETPRRDYRPGGRSVNARARQRRNGSPPRRTRRRPRVRRLSALRRASPPSSRWSDAPPHSSNPSRPCSQTPTSFYQTKTAPRFPRQSSVRPTPCFEPDAESDGYPAAAAHRRLVQHAKEREDDATSRLALLVSMHSFIRIPTRGHTVIKQTNSRSVASLKSTHFFTLSN